jgi:N-acetyltransferase
MITAGGSKQRKDGWPAADQQVLTGHAYQTGDNLTAAIDLDAYFARIGWEGGATPALDTLGSLLAAHMHSIPFENLDVLLDKPICLDLQSLQDKLVTRQRGDIVSSMPPCLPRSWRISDFSFSATQPGWSFLFLEQRRPGRTCF